MIIIMSRSTTFSLWISLKWWQIRQALQLPSNIMSHVGLAYFELTFTNSKCQLGRWNGGVQDILACLWYLPLTGPIAMLYSVTSHVNFLVKLQMITKLFLHIFLLWYGAFRKIARFFSLFLPVFTTCCISLHVFVDILLISVAPNVWYSHTLSAWTPTTWFVHNLQNLQDETWK